MSYALTPYHVIPVSKCLWHCWSDKGELIRDLLLWTPTYGRTNVGRPVKSYMNQLSVDTGCSLEDLPEAMDSRDGWQDRQT